MCFGLLLIQMDFERIMLIFQSKCGKIKILKRRNKGPLISCREFTA